MSNTPLWIQAKPGDAAINYAPGADRQFIQANFPTEGVIGTSDFTVSPRAAGANMSVDVSAGSCVVACDRGSNGGSYLCTETAITNVTVPAAPGSGSRTHLIVMQVNDPQLDAGSAYTSSVVCIADTGSGATVPQSALLLARVVVAAGNASVTAGMITGARSRAAQPGQELAYSQSTANTDSSIATGTEHILPINATVVVATACYIRLKWHFACHSVVSPSTGTSVEGSLYRASGTAAPTTSSTELAFYNRPFSEMGWIDVDGNYVDRVSAGTYTYGLSYIARSGKSYVWGARTNTPMQLTAEFGGIQ